MFDQNESEDNAYVEQYLADMMEKVDAVRNIMNSSARNRQLLQQYNKKKKEEALNQTKIETERQVNRSKTELIQLPKVCLLPSLVPS